MSTTSKNQNAIQDHFFVTFRSGNKLQNLVKICPKSFWATTGTFKRFWWLSRCLASLKMAFKIHVKPPKLVLGRSKLAQKLTATTKQNLKISSMYNAKSRLQTSEIMIRNKNQREPVSKQLELEKRIIQTHAHALRCKFVQTQLPILIPIYSINDTPSHAPR